MKHKSKYSTGILTSFAACATMGLPSSALNNLTHCSGLRMCRILRRGVAQMFKPDGPRFMRVTSPIWEDITNLPGILHAVEIPVGYRFDGASIPRLAWAIIGPPFEPDFCLAACVHDYYCDHSHEIGDYQARVIGDAVFFALLKKAGVPRWRRVLMYMAVRLNSWWFYGSQSCGK